MLGDFEVTDSDDDVTLCYEGFVWFIDYRKHVSHVFYAFMFVMVYGLRANPSIDI